MAQHLTQGGDGGPDGATRRRAGARMARYRVLVQAVALSVAATGLAAFGLGAAM